MSSIICWEKSDCCVVMVLVSVDVGMVVVVSVLAGVQTVVDFVAVAYEVVNVILDVIGLKGDYVSV